MGILLKIADSLLGGAVAVVVEGNADVHGARDEVIGDRATQPEVRYLQGTAYTVVFIRTAFLVFGFLEVGQHIGVTPPFIPQFNPALVVFGLSAHVEQAVERT